jgi:hypothetical protein
MDVKVLYIWYGYDIYMVQWCYGSGICGMVVIFIYNILYGYGSGMNSPT